MSCDICGEKLKGEGKKIFVSGAILTVCDKCSKYGSPVPPSFNKKSSSATVKGGKLLLQKLPKTFGKDVEYDIVPDYAKRIKEARENMGWTAEILAEQVKEKVSVIKKIESGKLIPSINLAKRLENVLDIKLLEPQIRVLDNLSTYDKSEVDITLGDVAEIKFKDKNDSAKVKKHG
ncbi:MAG: multiprotein bridging factor aMBF1 [archaeon YNP-LCB-003-016]|jgi:putative transcription factor|uniref:multiprotein bridging factor aMBF1 n=1 Tax=Candidatus Culexarchaeum yellowstonense TaxID=2928963 RepID=UPI0026EDAFD0|nr:multiprotein bridging factor aMBF1 [Candidatus Culexarchaeum yellowstonense]MCR6690961.1 multiprotein bridging factor aMBF1 [Candidatus Culexarchaeum yellowstonense]